MDKIVIAPKCQYGYNTDYFQMANRLSQKNIQAEVICFDQGFPKIEPPENVNVTYVERKDSKIANYLRNMLAIGRIAVKNKKDLNWIVVSSTIELCGLLPFLLRAFTPKIQWIMDVRTCSVVSDKRKRKLYDSLMLLSSYFFNKTTIISEFTAKRLKINKYEILPLGADCYVNLAGKEFSSSKINFLYVGKFDDRRIEDVITAFDIFSGKQNQNVESRLDIVGFSDKAEATSKIVEAIKGSGNAGEIVFHGRKSHDEIKALFQNATIGFSYVPITDFFDVQPPTKTFEYIMNGIICIGTRTKANSEIINEKNGVLTGDNVESLLSGMEEVIKNIKKYNSLEVAQTVNSSKWEHIVENFHVFLRQINATQAKANG